MKLPSKYILIRVAFLVFVTSIHAQQLNVVTTLSKELKESSALIYLQGHLISINDSGDKPVLYELDTLTGDIKRRVIVANATNHDWEALCFDDSCIYIGDIGNNRGARTDLKIYKLSISDYLNTPNDTVLVDTIRFRFSDQRIFNIDTTNHDAEALIAYNDSLYLFTKNWGNTWTNIYALPKTPGNYNIKKTDSLNVEGLITAASYNMHNNNVLLVGLTAYYPFLVEISNIVENKFSSADVRKIPLEKLSDYSYQIESITPKNAHQYYMSSESLGDDSATLYSVNLNGTWVLNEPNTQPTSFIYPNPANTIVHITPYNLQWVRIYNLHGKLVFQSTENTFDVSKIQAGIYIVTILSASKPIPSRQTLIIR